MQVSLSRQTPAASIFLMLLLVTAAFVRFAVAPYSDELIVGGAALPGLWVDAFQSRFPVWGTLISAVIVAVISITLGRLTSAFGLYQARTTISIPLYVVVACGIFIASDSLAVTLSAYFAMLMVRYLCGGYVRGTDLNYAFYAGICAALAPMFYAPAVSLVLLLPVAILMFGLSWREIVVMIAGLAIPLVVICYGNWFCGGTFSAPAIDLYDAVIRSNDYTLWGSESVVALAMMGFSLFVVFCGILSFAGDKRSVGVRPRTILAFHIVTFVVACATFALPSATAGVLMLVALPASVLMPEVLVRLRDGMSNLIIIFLVLLMILHIFIA